MSSDKNKSIPRLIPSTRLTIALLVSFALFVQYAQRVGLSMAIVCMVDRSPMTTLSNSTLSREEINNQTMITSAKYGSKFLAEKKFLWSEFQQQILLGAYWFGYIFTLVPSGWLSITLGAKKMFAGSLLLSSIATLAMCCIYFIDMFSFYLALIFRIIIGFMHGPIFPASYVVWSKWAVKSERSTLTAIGFCSNNLGTSLTMLLGGLLCRYVASGWIYIFLLTSIFGFLWLPLWLWLSADSPLTHRTINEKEKLYIAQGLKLNPNEKKNNISLFSLPWKKIVQSKPIIALFVTECCNLFGLFFFYTNVGKILTEIHRIPTQYAGYVLAGGFILMPVSSVLSGIIADRLVRMKMNLTTVRKLFNSIASFTPAICMIGLCFCDESRQVLGVIIILIFLITSAVAYGAGYIVNFVDLMPAFSSIIFGITTAAATVGALIANIIAGLIIKQPILQDWRKLFILFSIIYFIGGLIYVLLGSAKSLDWASPPSETKSTLDEKAQEEETIPMRLSDSTQSPTTA